MALTNYIQMSGTHTNRCFSNIFKHIHYKSVFNGLGADHLILYGGGGGGGAILFGKINSVPENQEKCFLTL